MALDNPFHKNLPIGKILATGALILVLALFCIAAVVYLQYRETSVTFQNAMAAAEARSLIAKVEHEMIRLTPFGGDAESRVRLVQDYEQLVKALQTLTNQNTARRILAAKETEQMSETLKQVKNEWLSVSSILKNDFLDNRDLWMRLDQIRADRSPGGDSVWLQTQEELRRLQDRLAQPLADLLGSTGKLSQLYAERQFNPYVVGVIVGLLLIILGVLTYMIRKVLQDVRGREHAAEMDARRNQEAILKLLEETTKMADGDITVRATVDEAITGAIADALNFTLEEIANLIRRINSTADQVTQETEGVQVISEKLFIASQQQSREIEQTANTVLQVTQSISEVAEAAAQSANVAQQSLEAAGKGATAVRSQINSMTDIRAQIQDTAKRIKRLGDSSLEIGEIVSMISDITDQTNVLALNAAIQAASAGEAGRGFAVVAEEVQRLAERSAEATKQIAAIVKTIQSDTQDAVSAMERSTSGVVEGTRLSEEAGDALADIERVSNRLAELIRNISRQTHAQSMSVDEVRADISKILKTTEAATKGTEQTTTSINRLSQAAAELRAAISGFKV